MTSKLKCPLCGHYAKDDGLNNTWWCSNQYCDSYEENSSKPYHALMNATRDLKIARQALKDARIFASTHCIASAVKTIDKALEQIEHKE